MNDTSKEFQKKQLEIILSKTPERFRMGIDMFDMAYTIVKNSIKKENPTMSEGEVVAALFKRYYQNDFSEEDLQKIASEIKAFHER